MTGHGLHHSDIGGYTTLFDMKRSKEELLRWCDFSAFTPMMRTHEGNRPGDNWQFDGDAETCPLCPYERTDLTTLKPYLKQAVAQNGATGSAGNAPAIPALRGRCAHRHPEVSGTCWDKICW